MACGATLSLKRSLEFDPLHSPVLSPKRRRCAPMTVSAAVPHTNILGNDSSPFANPSSITSEDIAAHISAEVKRIQHRNQLHYGPNPPSFGSGGGVGGLSLPGSPQSLFAAPNTSVFRDVACYGTTGSQSCASEYSRASSPPSSLSGPEVPLFTLRQVSLVCERMLKEREDKLREEYDAVLNAKLAEQYEAFLKFTSDYMYQRFGESAASYVS